jgi:hypothetical protein
MLEVKKQANSDIKTLEFKKSTEDQYMWAYNPSY